MDEFFVLQPNGKMATFDNASKAFVLTDLSEGEALFFCARMPDQFAAERAVLDLRMARDDPQFFRWYECLRKIMAEHGTEVLYRTLTETMGAWKKSW